MLCMYMCLCRYMCLCMCMYMCLCMYLCMYMCSCMYLCTSTEVPQASFLRHCIFFLRQYLTVLELANLDKQLQEFAHLRLPRAKIVHACHQAHLFLHGCWGSSSGPRVCAPGTLIADWSISPEQTNQPLKAQRSNLGFSSEKQYQSESTNQKEIKLAHHVQVSWFSC